VHLKWAKKFYAGNCTVGGVRKIRNGKLHNVPNPFSSKDVLVIMSASALESRVLRNGIPRIYYKISAWEDQGKLLVDVLAFMQKKKNNKLNNRN